MAAPVLSSQRSVFSVSNRLRLCCDRTIRDNPSRRFVRRRAGICALRRMWTKQHHRQQKNWRSSVATTRRDFGRGKFCIAIFASDLLSGSSGSCVLLSRSPTHTPLTIPRDYPLFIEVLFLGGSVFV